MFRLLAVIHARCLASNFGHFVKLYYRVQKGTPGQYPTNRNTALSHTASAIDITNYKLCLLQEKIQGLENRLNGVGTCIDKYTAWTGRSNAMIMNLDRHYLVCPSKYFLVSFRFQRQGSAYNSNVRYAYRCCKI